jgi:hypothetical protein
MPTMPCPPTGALSQRSPTGWFTSGVDRSCGAARRQGCRGHAWRGTAPGGSLRLESSIPGQSSVSTFGPEAGAQCVSSARWDLCGGRPETSLVEWPHQVKGRPYREFANSRPQKPVLIQVLRVVPPLNGVQEVASSNLAGPTSLAGYRPAKPPCRPSFAFGSLRARPAGSLANPASNPSFPSTCVCAALRRATRPPAESVRSAYYVLIFGSSRSSRSSTSVDSYPSRSNRRANVDRYFHSPVLAEAAVAAIANFVSEFGPVGLGRPPRVSMGRIIALVRGHRLAGAWVPSWSPARSQ